jgi:hypothetical protein
MRITNRNRWTTTCAIAGLALVGVAAAIEHTQGQQWLDPFTICMTFGIYLTVRSLHQCVVNERNED